MTDVTQHVGAIYIAAYGAMALLFIAETWISVLRLKYLRKHNLAKREPALYAYYLGSGVASALMGVRTMLNVFMCDSDVITILRILANGMLVYTLFMASRLLWMLKITTPYGCYKEPGHDKP